MIVFHHDIPASAKTAFLSRIIGDSAANSKLIKLVSLLVWPMCGAKDPGLLNVRQREPKQPTARKKEIFIRRRRQRSSKEEERHAMFWRWIWTLKLVLVAPNRC